MAQSDVQVISKPTSAPPTIDGVIGTGEWSNAATLAFTINTVSGTLYVMHDSTYLYVAAVISDPTVGLNSFQLIFDNTNSGTLKLGDDALVTNLGSVSADDFYNGANFVFDASSGGTNDIVGFGAYLNGIATFEVRHPLCSSDVAHDFCLKPGSTAGFNIVYQPGNGAFYSGFPSPNPFDAANFGDLLIPPLAPQQVPALSETMTILLSTFMVLIGVVALRFDVSRRRPGPMPRFRSTAD